MGENPLGLGGESFSLLLHGILEGALSDTENTQETRFIYFFIKGRHVNHKGLKSVQVRQTDEGQSKI